MAPNITSQTLLLAAEADIRKTNGLSSNYSQASSLPGGSKSEGSSNQEEEEYYEWKISWRNVLAFLYLHVASVYGFYLLVTGQVRFYTFLWNVGVTIFGALGVTAGAHRLWAHKAYKAKWQLRVILALLQTMAFQVFVLSPLLALNNVKQYKLVSWLKNHIYEWVRDHRVHHKFTDTNADPHNAKRGFFFSHMGWLMVRKHPDVKIKGATVDMSDMDEDFVVVWQKRTYLVLMPLLCFVMPTVVPIYFWSEDPWMAWYTTVLRYTLSLNFTWLVNSAAHIWGTKPYDMHISPAENTTVGVLALGEGWHNYHHVFPWDYKAAELGNYNVNLTTGFIDFFAKIGWAYNLRTVSLEVIKKRAQRTGDGSLRDPDDPKHHMNAVWGWGDKDMTAEEIESVTVSHPRKED